MRIYFARHGQSHANLRNVMENRPPGPGLTDLGVEQACNLGARLQGLGIAQIWASPLLRAEETGQHVAAILRLPYHTHAGLLEFDCGDLEGKGDEASWAEHWRTDRLWAEGHLDARVGGGESQREIQARFASFVHQLSGPPALVVAHGGLYRVALPSLLGLPTAFSRQHPIPNTALVVVERSPDGWRCLDWHGVKP